MLVASAVGRRIPVAVTTADPVSRAGITSQLRGSQLVEVVDESRLDLDSRQEAVAVVVAGSVLGISNTAVTPPCTAEREPVSRSSLWVRPGSRKCTWVSITPGKT